MKRTTITKVLCFVFSLILLVSAVPVMPLRLLAAIDQLSFAPQVSEAASDYDVSMHGELVGNQAVSDTDVFAMQVVLTADAVAISTSLRSYGNSTGSVTVALYSFEIDYDMTLLNAPIAEYTFTDFSDGGDLSLNFPEDKPLPAGEFQPVPWPVWSALLDWMSLLNPSSDC